MLLTLGFFGYVATTSTRLSRVTTGLLQRFLHFHFQIFLETTTFPWRFTCKRVPKSPSKK